VDPSPSSPFSRCLLTARPGGWGKKACCRLARLLHTRRQGEGLGQSAERGPFIPLERLGGEGNGHDTMDLSPRNPSSFRFASHTGPNQNSPHQINDRWRVMRGRGGNSLRGGIHGIEFSLSGVAVKSRSGNSDRGCCADNNCAAERFEPPLTLTGLSKFTAKAGFSA
jgi:hypothetical protein